MRNLQKIGVIYKKDMRHYFSTPIGYIFIAAVLLADGIYAYMDHVYYGEANFGASISSVPFFFVFLVPVLAAGVFAEEKRQRTEQLLCTLPLTPLQIVLGKYFALVTVLAAPLAIIGLYPLGMAGYGEVNFGQAYANLFAVLLLGMALLAICMFISSLTGNLIVSAAVCCIVLFLLHQMDTFAAALRQSDLSAFAGLLLLTALYGVFLWLMTKKLSVTLLSAGLLLLVLLLFREIGIQAMAGKLNLILNRIAIFDQLQYFQAGIFDLYAIIDYCAIIMVFILLTIYRLERRRWAE